MFMTAKRIAACAILRGVVCASAAEAAEDPPWVAAETITSDALRTNQLGDAESRVIKIILPPSYGSSDKRYPVVYFLHGHGGSPDQFVRVADTARDAMAAGTIKEFLIVCANGSTRFGGGFYVDSPVSGKFEEFIVKDTTTFVDARYRTLAKPESRAIAGFSMGGFGAINLGMRHPDVYAAVYALDPGLFAPDGLGKALPTWNAKIMDAYGTAFDPRSNDPDPHRGLVTPLDIGTGNATETAWNSGFGDLKTKIAGHIAGSGRLRAIRIDYGTESEYPWIREGALYFSGLLHEAGIAHEIDAHPIKHRLDRMVIEQFMLPFLDRALEGF